jgi:hypothetical protein
MRDFDMTGFAVYEPTREEAIALEKEWKIFNSKHWFGVHKETGLKMKAGTRHALINKLYCYKMNPW